jgi:hypothetical protein
VLFNLQTTVAWLVVAKECVKLEDQAGRRRQKTENKPVRTGLSEFNPAILLNIWPAVTLPSLSFDTMDPSVSWGGIFL